MTVYVDLVMVLNFLVDFCLLIGTNRLSGYPPGWKRCLLGAAFGGLYSGVCMFPEFRFLGNTLWRIISLLMMAWISFGMGIRMLRQAGVFLILSMALGGLVMSFGRGEWLPLLCCGVILWSLCRLGFPNPPGSVQYEMITIRHGERTVKMLALRDTGNTLTDPLTGEPVLVISGKMASLLTGITDAQLRSPLETLSQGTLPGLRLIPCRTVSGGGMLLAMRFADVQIGNRKCSVIVAFAPDGLGRGDSFQALTGGAL